MPSVTINGRTVEAREGAYILEAAKQADAKMMTCSYEQLEERLVQEIEACLQGQYLDSQEDQ